MQFLKKILPPDKWQVPVAIILGIFVGLGIYTFKVSNAASYLSDDPKTCINCHVMYSDYASWFHSSHRERATCSDCHVPHTNIVAKFFFKANDGLRHSTVFTMRTEPQVIRIKHKGIRVVQENCVRCHSHTNENVSTYKVTGKNHNQMGKLCWECHRDVPHGRVRSLSSTPNALVPKLDSPVPEWLKKLTK